MLEKSMTDKIKPIYSELQGYLAQAPNNDAGSIRNQDLDTQVNKAIEELQEISDNNYSRFKINKHTSSQMNKSYTYIHIQDYRSKLGGLISRLHAEFFSDEPPPFNSMPQTVINQNQNQAQTQEMRVNIVQEMMDILVRNEAKFDYDSDEAKFIDKIKAKIKSVSNITDLVSTILKTGKEMGLTVAQILNIFS